jgi:uncharacterized membrane protein YdbT with pleckstrin-like domain
MVTTHNDKQATSQGLSIAAMTLGIISIVTVLLWFLAIILGVLAIVFGAVSLRSAGRKKALAGIITGSIGIILSILLVVVVLTAVPALQRNQRDSMRKSDLTTLSSDIVSYQSNNRGQLPTAEELSADSLGRIQSVRSTGEPTTGEALYLVGVDCQGNASSPRSYSLTVVLDDGSIYCLDS